MKLTTCSVRRLARTLRIRRFKTWLAAEADCEISGQLLEVGRERDEVFALFDVSKDERRLWMLSGDRGDH